MSRLSSNIKDLRKMFYYENKMGFDNEEERENAIKSIIKDPVKKDLTLRTLKGLGKLQGNNRDKWEKGFEEILNNVAEKIYNDLSPLNDGEKQFEDWHKETCKDIVDDVNELLKNCGLEETKISYGKAQKIVNMAFKYILCCDEKQEFKAIYEKCHMPIDSYILSWYNNKVRFKYKEGKFNESWSNLSDDDYKKIQDNIKEYLEDEKTNKYLPKERLYAEFYIWPFQMIHDNISNLNREIQDGAFEIFVNNEKLVKTTKECLEKIAACENYKNVEKE